MTHVKKFELVLPDGMKQEVDKVFGGTRSTRLRVVQNDLGRCAALFIASGRSLDDFSVVAAEMPKDGKSLLVKSVWFRPRPPFAQIVSYELTSDEMATSNSLGDAKRLPWAKIDKVGKTSLLGNLRDMVEARPENDVFGRAERRSPVLRENMPRIHARYQAFGPIVQRTLEQMPRV